MTEKSDEQVLAQARGKCWHEYTHGWLCKKCGFRMVNPDFTSSAELWDLLMYMVGREDWRRFYTDMWDKYTVEQREWSVYGYIPWLTDPARFVHLCADWCREHPEKGE